MHVLLFIIPLWFSKTFLWTAGLSVLKEYLVLKSLCHDFLISWRSKWLKILESTENQGQVLPGSSSWKVSIFPRIHSQSWVSSQTLLQGKTLICFSSWQSTRSTSPWAASLSDRSQCYLVGCSRDRIERWMRDRNV